MTRAPGQKPVILFVTYTMLEPVVGGAFFRALRLAVEFAHRGWTPIVCNNGPMLTDPKIDQARGLVEFVALDREDPELTAETARRFFKSFNPTVIVFGEGPFEVMKIFYTGAQQVGRPLVVLDQFYNNWLVPDTQGVDLVLLYGLRAIWGHDYRLGPPYVLVPPFIEAVTPKMDLPIPTNLHGAPWVIVIAYQPDILERGVALAAQARRLDVVIITVSHAPDQARGLLDTAGIPSQRSVTLPLQSDANVFGLMGASRVAIISNGFLQIMEALAMACPVICISRTAGITSFNVDERFGRYVSIDENERHQRDRLAHWLAETPFSPALRAALANERGGISRCADLIEEVSRYDA